uniref:Uncharacterized protein n=1 Tax=viral metagenome TaxID=1070528 RepID=A0A6C0IWE1_9ZZZZ
MKNQYWWKWSLGESYYKSARPEKQNNTNVNTIEPIDNTYNAINQSLDENSLSLSNYHFDNEMIGITNSVFSRNQNDQNNSKREDLDTRIADREMIAQRGINPFLTSSNYVNDISASDNFLKPINTSTGKPVETNKSL